MIYRYFGGVFSLQECLQDCPLGSFARMALSDGLHRLLGPYLAPLGALIFPVPEEQYRSCFVWCGRFLHVALRYLLSGCKVHFV
jgi:hypothetical protein